MSAADHFPGLPVYRYPLIRQDIPGRLPPGPAQQAADPGGKFQHPEGLHHVIISAAVQSYDLIQFLFLGRQEHDGNILKAVGLPHLLNGRNPIHSGKHPVKDGQVRLFLLHPFKALLRCLKPF